ncbi:MAG: alcohol dehydrogenase catalytic domain-containing protein [Streptosporangiales bacterium]|nr:alcohol dehydrogenase catalytic domain-containing protein [Streptosporangiales bacterium]
MARPPDTHALASVALGDGRAETRTFPLRDCPPDAGWLRVEASGVCGTDVGLFTGALDEPCVLGHHVLGQVAALGDVAASRWALRPSDWVVLEEYLPCGRCAMCHTDRYRLCPDTDLWKGGRRIGLVGTTEEPGLWGGNAQYLHLPPNAVLHRIPGGLAPGLAVWALPLANALDWVLGAGRLGDGETIVILGPGYHGIAAAAVARYAGAKHVVVCGLPRDRARLRFAESLGATTLELGDDDLAGTVAGLTGRPGADVVLDLAASRPETLGDNIRLLGHGGRLVLASPKSPALAGVDTTALIRLTAGIVGVRGRSPQRVQESIALLQRGGLGLEQVPTEEIPLSEVGSMLGRLAAGEGPDTPHVVVRPWLDG